MSTHPAARALNPAPGELPRLLAGVGDHPITSLEEHLRLHGPLPDLRGPNRAQLIDLVERSGLRGHGGAAFPVATKLRAVGDRRKPKIVIANGSEGEPASKKDRAMLREAPHLVLDGAAVAARAVDASHAIIAISQADRRGWRSMALAVRERLALRPPGDAEFEMVPVPELFVTGQETALVNYLSGGEAKPTFGNRPFERGVRQRPTLVQNVETLGHLALIARHGPDWFRSLGTERDPGSTLVTLSGAVGAPGVYEVEHGMQLSQLLQTGGLTERPRAVLTGGYFGNWLPAGQIQTLRLSPGSSPRRAAASARG